MKNKIIASLMVVTGVLFAAAVLVEPTTAVRLCYLATVSGLSAVFTKILIKENTNV